MPTKTSASFAARPRLGALERWRAEIRAGTRHNTAADFDDLAAAACNELAALQCTALGDHGKARMFLDRALLRLRAVSRIRRTRTGFTRERTTSCGS